MFENFDPLSIFNAAEFFRWFVENASYLFVFLFMVVESSFIPFPSEVVVPPAAYLAVAGTAAAGQSAAGGNMTVTGVILAATAGALVGALINYGLSLWIGRPLVYRFADSRFGHACLIDRAKVEHAEKYFDEHGAVSTFVGRLIPAVRQLISIPAGLARMNICKFMTFTTLGALVWNTVLGLLGYWLGKTVPLDKLFDKVEYYNTYLSYIGFGILLVCVAYILFKAFAPGKKRHAGKTDGTGKISR